MLFKELLYWTVKSKDERKTAGTQIFLPGVSYVCWGRKCSITKAHPQLFPNIFRPSMVDPQMQPMNTGEGTLYNCQYTISRILFGLSVTSNVLDRSCSASLRESSLWRFMHWRYRAGLLLWPSLAYPDGYMAPFYIFLYVRKEICWDSVQLHQRDGHLFFSPHFRVG